MGWAGECNCNRVAFYTPFLFFYTPFPFYDIFFFHKLVFFGINDKSLFKKCSKVEPGECQIDELATLLLTTSSRLIQRGVVLALIVAREVWVFRYRRAISVVLSLGCTDHQVQFSRHTWAIVLGLNLDWGGMVWKKNSLFLNISFCSINLKKLLANLAITPPPRWNVGEGYPCGMFVSHTLLMVRSFDLFSNLIAAFPML